MRGPDSALGKQRRWQFAPRNQTPNNEIAKLEYPLSVQLKAMSDPEGSRRPDEQPARPPSTPWEVGLPRGRGRQEPQHYAQSQQRMQPYPTDQRGGYTDAMLAHGPGASSGDSGARLSPGGGLLTRAWRAVASVMVSPGKPRTDAPHQGRDASDSREGGLCHSAEMAGQEGTEQESGQVSGFAHGRGTAGRTPNMACGEPTAVLQPAAQLVFVPSRPSSRVSIPRHSVSGE